MEVAENINPEFSHHQEIKGSLARLSVGQSVAIDSTNLDEPHAVFPDGARYPALEVQTVAASDEDLLVRLRNSGVDLEFLEFQFSPRYSSDVTPDEPELALAAASRLDEAVAGAKAILPLIQKYLPPEMSDAYSLENASEALLHDVVRTRGAFRRGLKRIARALAEDSASLHISLDLTQESGPTVIGDTRQTPLPLLVQLSEEARMNGVDNGELIHGLLRAFIYELKSGNVILPHMLAQFSPSRPVESVQLTFERSTV